MSVTSALQELRAFYAECRTSPRVAIVFLATISLLVATLGLFAVAMMAGTAILSIIGALPAEEKKSLSGNNGPIIYGAIPAQGHRAGWKK